MRVKFFLFFYIFNNMENIIEPNETFDFTKLTLSHPVGIQGGAYFTKIEYNNKPLYIQTNKSQTRQGFVKTGKKYYCDLMFDKNSETLIHWFENLEEKCQKIIFEKRFTWFQNNLEESDIEIAFNSTIRVYKSGKYYLIRTNVKNNHNNLPAIKIYNETEIPFTMDDVKPETNIISILEIKGIKFTSRNFQIEIEVKQMMVLDNEPIFNNCLIKTNKVKQNNLENLVYSTILETDRGNAFVDNTINIDNVDSLQETEQTNDLNNLGKIDEQIKTSSNDDQINLENTEELEEFEEFEDEKDNKNVEEMLDDLITNDIHSDISEKKDGISLEIQELNMDDDNIKLQEVSFSDNLNNLETIKLKKPNQVYFELYREARNKAKIAKKNALLAYLEAKNIKKTYMLENIYDNDSDIDEEIDEVSESELDGL